MSDAIGSASKAGLWRKGRVDLFSIFERRNREALRSDVLAWLLDPDESHGCQDLLLRQVFKHIGIGSADFGRVSVAREHWLSQTRRVHVFVKIGRIWLAIENKIDAPEGDCQLTDYANALARTGTLNEDRFLLYVTPKGTPCPQGSSISWLDLARMVEKLEPPPIAAPIVEHILQDFENILWG